MPKVRHMARDEACQGTEQRIEAAYQEGVIKLDLSRLELTEVPEAITRFLFCC